MPDLVVSNDGEKYLLDRAVSVPWTTPETWSVHLYKNDYVPTRDVVLANLLEADFSSYLPKTLLRTVWTAANTIAGRAQTFYPGLPQQWLSTGAPQEIFGYYITVPSLGVLLLAQRFDSPVLVTNIVPAVVLPQLALHSESEPP